MEIEELKQDDAVDSIYCVCIGKMSGWKYGAIQKLCDSVCSIASRIADTYAVNAALAPAMRDYGAYVFTNADDIDTSSNNALRSRWYLAEEEGIYIG